VMKADETTPPSSLSHAQTMQHTSLQFPLDCSILFLFNCMQPCRKPLLLPLSHAEGSLSFLSYK
jgi:hypothetical protein